MGRIFKLWLLSWIVVSVMLAFDQTGAIAKVLFIFVITMPSLAFINLSWKWVRFLGLPTPIQLLKGFSRQWPKVQKGHVVTRVHRPRP